MQEEATMLSLKWDSFSSQMTNSLDVCYEKQYFVDLSLVCKNGTILKCHKMVLANASSFFRRLLVINEHPHPMIILHDIEADDLKIVINFMYSGEIQVSKSKVRRILKIGEILEVSGLKDIRGTILTSKNDKIRHDNPATSVNTENSIKIVETRSLRKNTRVEPSVSTTLTPMTRVTRSSFRNCVQRKNESVDEIESNPKFQSIPSKKHENIMHGNKIEKFGHFLDSNNGKPEMTRKIGKSTKKRAHTEKEITWTKVLSQICGDNEDLPLKKLCLMNEVEISKSVPMEKPDSPIGKPPDNYEASDNLSLMENYVNCGVHIKDEVDTDESDCESNNSTMERDERLMNNSAIDIFENVDHMESVDKNDSSS